MKQTLYVKIANTNKIKLFYPLLFISSFLLIILLETQPTLAWTHPFIMHGPVIHKVQPIQLPISFNTNNNTNTFTNGGNNQSQSSENNNENNNDNHTEVNVSNNNDISITTAPTPVVEIANVQPLVVAQPVLVTRLPQTGTPLMSWSFLAFFPIGFFIRKFSKIS